MRRIIWTKHSENKMKFYNISKQRVLRVLNKPYRLETGVAPKTLACMQPVGKSNKKKWKQEIWVMYQKVKGKLKIISVWRYPGVSPQSQPIPVEIINELKNLNLI